MWGELLAVLLGAVVGALTAVAVFVVFYTVLA
jgi:hypothetical protein